MVALCKIPKRVAVNTANIPQELKDRRQFVCWNYEERDGKLTKFPRQVNGRPASSTDPATWNSFEAVEAAYENGNFSGIGFVLSADDPYVGIDLDHCYDGSMSGCQWTDEQRECNRWTADAPDPEDIIGDLDSYTEVSPSGTGIRVICRGAIAKAVKSGGFEVYGDSRFLTLTGNTIHGCPVEIADAQEALDKLLPNFDATGEVTPAPSGSLPERITDGNILGMARDAKNSEKFKKLYDAGDTSDYQSQSEADLALCSMLAFWCRNDAARIDNLFRDSKLYRDKWDELHGEQTYGAMTIEKSLSKELYDWGRTGLPEIILSGDLPRVSEQGIAALVASNEPPRIFMLGDMPSRLKETTEGHATEPLNVDRMRYEVARAADWKRLSKKGDSSPATPPDTVAKDILASPTLPFPQLTRIVNAPVFASDGTLHSEPGYNAASRCYYDPRGFVCPEVSEKPTAAELERAKGIIFSDVLVDFKFAEQASRCHALALALGPFVREMIDGPTPIHLIYKPRAGVGGGLLTSVLTGPFLGREPSPVTAPSSEDEWRKKITAGLTEAPSIFYIDNANDIDSASLAAATTTMRFKDRMLGSSIVADLPVQCIWIAVGNNPTLTQEIRRRCLPIHLIADGPEPELRSKFKHAQLRRWCTDHRGEIVWALLTIVRHWIARGRPMSDKVFGSYEEWVRVMGGILKAAGVEGFLENLSEVKDLDTEGASEQAMVQSWVEKGWHTEGKTITARTVREDAVSFGVLENVSSRAAGRMLARLNGKTFVVSEGEELTEVTLVLDRGDAKRGNTFKLVGVSK